MLLAKCAVTPRLSSSSPAAKERLPVVLAHLIPSGGMRPTEWCRSDELLTPRVGTFPPGCASTRGRGGLG